jgi:nucleotide-binding universal stress UspA family protein
VIKSILVPLDETRLSEKVLDGIRPILCRADVEVILLRVLEIPADEEVSDELVEATREHLARVVDSLQGVQVITKIRLGDPAEEIHKFALLRQVSLIGMFTHARKGLEHFVMGSVARGVLRRATCPVLLVNPYVLKKPAKSATSLHRILVALDGSKTSEEIIAPVTEFATLLDSKVVLFHEELGIPEFGTRSSHHSEILGPPAERLKALGIEVETQSSLYSEPAVAILEQADRLGSDLIAMTTHGRSGVARGLFGSVAEAVLRQAKNPVLIQRTSNTRAGGDEVQYTKG